MSQRTVRVVAAIAAAALVIGAGYQAVALLF